MKRTKTKKPSAILTSDWHLREDQPLCRTDDFWEAQRAKLEFISELQAKYDCPVIHAGDLFHHWKPSPRLLSFAIDHLPKNSGGCWDEEDCPTFQTVYGQHDLPQHNLGLADKSGVATLEKANRLEVLKGIHYGQPPGEFNTWFNRGVLVWHKMTWVGKSPWPGCTDPSAEELMEEYQYSLIITGDNHKSFVVEKDGRLLVNPGSITRQTADQATVKPKVYLWYAKTNTVEPVYLPIKRDVISRAHIEHKAQRDSRIEAFISRLDGEWEAEISFEENLKRFAAKNRIRKSVMQLIQEAIEK